MANLYPNVSVTLGMNAKLSGFFENAKSWFNKDFYVKICDFFKKPTLAGFFTNFWSGFFAGFMGWVSWVGFFVPTLTLSPLNNNTKRWLSAYLKRHTDTILPSPFMLASLKGMAGVFPRFCDVLANCTRLFYSYMDYFKIYLWNMSSGFF